MRKVITVQLVGGIADGTTTDIYADTEPPIDLTERIGPNRELGRTSTYWPVDQVDYKGFPIWTANIRPEKDDTDD